MAAFINEQETTYLELLLKDENPENKKVGLQRLCAAYRAGSRLQRSGPFQLLLNGLLHDPNKKVLRWTFAAIALLGSRYNVQALVGSIDRVRSDPELTLAGVAALFALTGREEAAQHLLQIDVPLDGAILLASAQFDAESRLKLASAKVNIDNSSALELRFAALLIGLNKAPDHLFTSDHENADVIGTLNIHDDDMVAQYSVWAISENPSLGFIDLGLSVKDIEGQPDNVRSWLYRIIVQDEFTAENNREFISLGTRDDSDEAREGLAAAMRGIYFSGADGIVIDWYSKESNTQVQQRLLEHMATNAFRAPGYLEPVLSAYRDAGHRSLTRARLETASRKTELYARLRRIELDVEEALLFPPRAGERGHEVTVNQNISGNVTIGALSGSGNATAGNVGGQFSAESAELILKIVSAAQSLLREGVRTPAKAAEGARLVAEATKTPSRSIFQRLLGWLSGLKEGSDFVVSAAGSVHEISNDIMDLLS